MIEPRALANAFVFILRQYFELSGLPDSASDDAVYEAIKNRLAENVTLRAQVEAVRALHTPGWIDGSGKHHDHTVVIYGQPPAGHVCRIGREWDNCAPCPESPDDAEHYALACVECGGVGDEGEGTSLLWPCPTALATESKS